MLIECGHEIYSACPWPGLVSCGTKTFKTSNHGSIVDTTAAALQVAIRTFSIPNHEQFKDSKIVIGK